MRLWGYEGMTTWWYKDMRALGYVDLTIYIYIYNDARYTIHFPKFCLVQVVVILVWNHFCSKCALYLSSFSQATKHIIKIFLACENEEKYWWCVELLVRMKKDLGDVFSCLWEWRKILMICLVACENEERSWWCV